MAQQPPVGHGLLIIEASRSHSDAPHSVGLLWTSDRPVSGTPTWQHNTHTQTWPSGIQTRNSRERAVTDPCLRPRGHRDRPLCCKWDEIHRVIHKSLRDFRTLRYSSRDGHAEGEHVNGGTDTPSFCPTLQVLDMSTLGDAADVKFGNFGKFQDTERFLSPCPSHVSSRLPSSGETCKYATAPSTQKKLEEILYLLTCSFLLCLSLLLCSRLWNFRRNLWITL